MILRMISDKLARLHWLLTCIILLLSAIGIAMLYSAAGGEMHPWAFAQLLRFVPAIVLMFLLAIIPIRWMMIGAYPFYILCIALLVVVEVGGEVGMGAQRWINLGFFRLQPSELMKIGIILALAHYYQRLHKDNLNKPLWLLPAVLMIALPAFLILKQPNLGTTMILAFISISVLFAAGLNWRYFAGGALASAASAPLVWQLLHDYQKRRVMTFLDPTTDPLGAGYNITQSIIAIGSGGLKGKGFMQGSQGQLDFLPEKQTDFIFTMLAEEFGFIGSMGLLALYAILLMLILHLMLRTRHRFGQLIAAGVMAMLFIHIMINMGMGMGLMPVVGVPLPFLSYGGSFLLSCLMAVGLLLNVHLHRKERLDTSMRL